MEVKDNSVSIIGCGWLGLSFAKSMTAKGWKVKASTTSNTKLTTLKSYGIEMIILKFPVEGKLDLSHFQSAYLLISFPPGRINKETSKSYSLSISQIVEAANKSIQIKKIIFTSSTSVYEKKSNSIDENSPATPTTISGQAILEAEHIIAKSRLPHVILRFGGLAGPQRHPGKFLAGKAGLLNGNQMINFLHLEDAVGVINYIMESSIENEIFNVVAPVHYTKKIFYTKMSESIGLQPPEFIKSSSQFNVEISNAKMLSDTDYKFIYPDPMKFKY